MVALALAGCAVTPLEQLDTTTDFRSPSSDKAGIYVYQWKSGIIGAAVDVNFEIRGLPKIALNTGEFGYLEAPPGQYEYKAIGGLLPIYLPVKFDAGRNYFFRAALSQARDGAILVKDQIEVDEVKRHILSGRYELHDVD